MSGIREIGCAQVSETQQGSHPLQLTVLRAHNLSLPGRRSRFYVSVTDGARTWQTRCVQRVGDGAEWNENVDAFVLRPLSRITISLFAKRAIQKDILVGKQEIVCETHREWDIVFGRADGHSTERAPPHLTIIVSSTASSSVTPIANPPDSARANIDGPVAEGGDACPTDQINEEVVQPTAVTAPRSPSPKTNGLPAQSDTPVGPEADSQTEMSVTALRHAEEAIEAMKTWNGAVEVLKQVMDAVRPIAELNTYASTAWKVLSLIPETLLKQVYRDNNIRTLLEAIREAFEFTKEADVLRNIKPESMQAKILEDMLLRVYEFAKFIESYAKDVQVGKRTLRNIAGQVDGEIEHYRTVLVRLRDNFLTRATITTEVTVLQMNAQLREMSNQALEAELDAKIREMPYKGGWRFGDEKRCLPGTRKEFLDHIFKWVENPESERGLVLLGQAGTGKSSIAHEVARRFEKDRLGCYFSFLRKEQSKDEAYQLFTTLARDLSDRSHAFKLALGKVIKDNSSLRGTRDYRTLFEYLILEPLKNLQLADPILIVIDAIDESGDAFGKFGLHTFLAQHIFDLPPKFRIFITSRPENGIQPAFLNALSVRTLQMDDAILAAKTEQDIGVYLQKELPRHVYRDHGDELAKSAEGLFQWAAVACGFINNPPASFGFSEKKCVQRLLGHSRDRTGQDPLDKLYEEVLEGYFKPHEALMLFRSVMGQLLAAIEPFSVRDLIALRRYAPIDDPEDSGPVVGLLRHLGSLLSNVTSPDQAGPIVPLHTSFRDFLTNKKSEVFYVDLGDAHHQLAHSCLSLMLDTLKFNICELESSYLANNDVPDLESRITKHISPALSYASIYWDDHLEQTPFQNELFEKLQALFKTKFLFWLEVLSIKSSVGLASPALSSSSIWLQQESSKTEVKSLLALVNDASAFVRYFGMTVAKSAPHIYISALPFAPTSSPIRNQYLHQFPRILTFERGQLSRWPALEMTIRGHGGGVESIAFSPDGQRIASASDDRMIRVWDATTGQLTAGPFTGHTSSVRSVAFSPDGQRIASASDDRTIRVWDATTGQVVAGPFTRRTESVTSIAFSSDGQGITSASFDVSIRVFEAATGQVIAGPFTGHPESVTSVAFSPDGQQVAFALDNGTIRMWDDETEQVVASSSTGHTKRVRSIAFSPDGQHIASASDDRTIRVWDVKTDQVAGPFTGHTDSVSSVSFSWDGQRIASASSDFTIRVWDVTTGLVVAGPFPGCTELVTSVAFSPDGQRIASALNGRTVCVLDAASGQVVAGPFTGYTESAMSVAFSPDGQHIASASWDGTIRVLDAATGQVIGRPLSSPARSFRSVSFSPDGDRIALASQDVKIFVSYPARRRGETRPFSGCAFPFRSVAFSPDWQRIASASDDGTICVLDAVTGQVIAGPFTRHTKSVTSVAFSPDGRHLASASWRGKIRVLNATTGCVIAGPFIGHTGLIQSVTFSPTGQHIASCSYDSTIRVWDAATGQVVAGPFNEYATSAAFSPDGKRIASASHQTIRMWDATAGQVEASPFTRQNESVIHVASSPDGQRIASVSWEGTICVFDAATGRVVTAPFTAQTEGITYVAFSPDWQRIASASGNGTIHVLDAATGQIIAGPFTAQTPSIGSADFSPDAQRIALSTSDRMIRVLDVTTGQVVAGPFGGYSSPVRCIAFSPDGQHIASASGDCTIRIWDSTTGQVAAGPFTCHGFVVDSIVFSPDGLRMATTSMDGTIRLWDAVTGQVIAGPCTGHTSSVSFLVFSPDGQRIASASEDLTIRVWDAATGKVIAGPFSGHSDAVSAIVFSLDGQCIASGSWDGMTRVLDVTTGSASFLPGGTQATSTSGNGTHHVAKTITEDTTRKIQFTDQSLVDSDGWICGEGKELLLWVPELHRNCLHRPSTVWMSGGEHETRLDTSKFVHGSDWATVHDHGI